jgi:hypothetical protein
MLKNKNKRTVKAWALAIRIKGKYYIEPREIYLMKTYAHLRALQIGETKYEVIKVEITHQIKP